MPVYDARLGWSEGGRTPIRDCIQVQNGVITAGPGAGWTTRVPSASRDANGKLQIQLELPNQGSYDNGKPYFKNVIIGTISEDHGDSWIMYGTFKGPISCTSYKYDGSLEYDVQKEFSTGIMLHGA